MLKKPYAIASIYHTRCLMAPKARILNLRGNTFPLSMNIWTKQARRLASEFKKMIMKSKRGHEHQRAQQKTRAMISLWVSIILRSYTKLLKCTMLNYCQNVIENSFFINKQISDVNTILLNIRYW